ETFDHAGLMIPRQKDLSFHTAVLALDLKTFLEIAAHRNCEVKMPQRAARKLDLNKPAISSEAFAQPRLHANELVTEKSRCVHQVAGVCQNKIAPFVGFGITPGLACRCACKWDWLQIVRHRVAIDRVPVPRFERKQSAHFFLNKFPRKGNARIKA